MSEWSLMVSSGYGFSARSLAGKLESPCEVAWQTPAQVSTGQVTALSPDATTAHDLCWRLQAVYTQPILQRRNIMCLQDACRSMAHACGFYCHVYHWVIEGQWAKLQGSNQTLYRQLQLRQKYQVAAAVCLTQCSPWPNPAASGMAGSKKDVTITFCDAVIGSLLSQAQQSIQERRAELREQLGNRLRDVSGLEAMVAERCIELILCEFEQIPAVTATEAKKVLTRRINTKLAGEIPAGTPRLNVSTAVRYAVDATLQGERGNVATPAVCPWCHQGTEPPPLANWSHIREGFYGALQAFHKHLADESEARRKEQDEKDLKQEEIIHYSSFRTLLNNMLGYYLTRAEHVQELLAQFDMPNRLQTRKKKKFQGQHGVRLATFFRQFFCVSDPSDANGNQAQANLILRTCGREKWAQLAKRTQLDPKNHLGEVLRPALRSVLEIGLPSHFKQLRQHIQAELKSNIASKPLKKSLMDTVDDAIQAVKQGRPIPTQARDLEKALRQELADVSDLASAKAEHLVKTLMGMFDAAFLCHCLPTALGDEAEPGDTEGSGGDEGPKDDMGNDRPDPQTLPPDEKMELEEEEERETE